jgi:uncharacterized integral membrane protein
MRFFGWLAFLVAVVVAIFAIQNSALPLVTMKLLVWQLETSPVYAMLGSLVVGVLITVLVWIPFAIKGSIRRRDLRKEIEVLRRPAPQEKDDAGREATDHDAGGGAL